MMNMLISFDHTVYKRVRKMSNVSRKSRQHAVFSRLLRLKLSQ